MSWDAFLRQLEDRVSYRIDARESADFGSCSDSQNSTSAFQNPGSATEIEANGARMEAISAKAEAARCRQYLHVTTNGHV